jgi:hypothetical protein
LPLSLLNGNQNIQTLLPEVCKSGFRVRDVREEEGVSLSNK